MKLHVIQLPHLESRVIVRKKLKGDLDDAGAYTKRVCAGEYEITLPLPIKGRKTASRLVHELIHILQLIVEDNTMQFTKEREHLAYIADYLFNEVCKL